MILQFCGRRSFFIVILLCICSTTFTKVYSATISDDQKKILHVENTKEFKQIVVKKNRQTNVFVRNIKYSAYGRPRMALGLGGALNFWLHPSDVLISSENIDETVTYAGKIGGRLWLYALYNIIDASKFLLAVQFYYYEGFHNYNALQIMNNGGSEYSIYSASTFGVNMNIGANITKWFSMYAIVGVSMMYNYIKPYAMAQADFFNLYPTVGIGMEFRFHRRFAIKAEYLNVLMTSTFDRCYRDNCNVYYDPVAYGLLANGFVNVGIQVYI